MKPMLVLILGFLLAGCSPLPEISIPVPSPSITYLHNFSSTPLFLSPTSTPTKSPTETEIPTVTPSIIENKTLTEIPTDAPGPWNYVFPIQPSSLAEFSEGLDSHGYPATDLFAEEGTKFVAVTNGLVDFVSFEDRWNPEQDDLALRGGLCVAIIGDDGVRYYGSHLLAIQSGINPGVRVTAGQLLGYVGHTGNARSTPSHVHFGISHPSFPEDWHLRRGEVDPFPFLLAWRDGQNVTPPLPIP
jgi:murein DD-endopeptidase MepM/ murein hydrolase activator NlpD